MRVTLHIARAGLALGALAGLVPLASGATAGAQAADGGPASAALERKVDLRLGATTLAAAAATISSQTGLRIEPAAYLTDHRLILFIRSTTLKGALDSLCEMNDWRWEEDKPGHILVARRRPPIPRRVADVAKAVQAALPRDYRDFLARSLSPEETQDKQYDALKQAEMRELIAVRVVRSRVEAITQMLHARLCAAIANPHPSAAERVKFESLSPALRTDLAVYLVLDALANALQHDDSGPPILGVSMPYQSDPDSAVVIVKNGGIDIRTIEDRPGAHVERGFGAGLGPTP